MQLQTLKSDTATEAEAKTGTERGSTEMGTSEREATETVSEAVARETGMPASKAGGG